MPAALKPSPRTRPSAVASFFSTASLIGFLKALDVRTTIDDFGTGYSSSSDLHHFAAGNLRIDRSFVSEVAAGAPDLSVVSPSSN